MDKLVINVSDKSLTEDQLSVLSKGLNFCPTPDHSNPGDLRTDLDCLHRRLRLHSYFNEDEDELPFDTDGNYFCTTEFKHHKFKTASKFNPPGPPNLEAFITLNEHEFNYRPAKQAAGYQNLTRGEKTALFQLKKMEDIIIKQADKGRSVVIQSRDQYLAEGYKQLADTNFYKEIDLDLTAQRTQEINSFLLEMLQKEEINVSVYNYLALKECRTSILYLLPKIHKGISPPPGRPIVSAINSPTERISKFIDHFLNPCATRVPSYVKDTTHFLTILDQLEQLPTNSWLVTLDVTSLYTNIPNKGGLFAAKEALSDFRPNPNVKPSNTSLLTLMNFVLTKNNFQFNGKHYLQTGGTSMGTKMAPAYANVFMGQFENDFVYTYHNPPLVWVRFIDDIFCIFTGTLDELNSFINYLNSCDPHIKFTSEISQTTVTFLDTRVNLSHNKIETDLFCKPTDSHNYLLFSSSHPRRCKESIPFSQLLRIRRICSRLVDFDKHMKETTLHFINRGYPIDLLEEAALKARRLDRKTLLYPVKVESKLDRSILTTTFHPHHDTLKKLVSKNWSILGKSHTTLPLFNRRPLVAYKRPPNLANFLVRADCRSKLDSHSDPQPQFVNPVKQATKQTSIKDFFSTNKPIAATTSLTDLHSRTNLPRLSVSLVNLRKPRRKCTNFKCNFCPYLNKSPTITCTATGEIFPSKYNITCKSSNLIYCITCKTCKKQYVGQTKNTIVQRFQGHFFNIRHKKQTDAVGMHFSQPDHRGLKDLSIQILEFIRLPPQSEKALYLRLTIEKSWIHKLRCPAPRGLNIFD